MYIISIQDSNCPVTSAADVQKNTQMPLEYCLTILHHWFICHS